MKEDDRCGRGGGRLWGGNDDGWGVGHGHGEGSDEFAEVMLDL